MQQPVAETFSRSRKKVDLEDRSRKEEEERKKVTRKNLRHVSIPQAKINVG